MDFRWFLSLFFLSFQPLQSIELQYGLYAQKGGVLPIEKAQLFGERCSGTNYFQELLRRNFHLESRHRDFGWKHFPVWFEAGEAFKEVLEDHGGSPFLSQENEGYVFFVIFRDPYEWLWSFSHCLWHAHRDLKERARGKFSLFIREPWISQDRLRWVECDPATGEVFPNVIQLRTARIQNMLKLKEQVKNIYYVQYEVLRDFPLEVMKEIAQFFELPYEQLSKVQEQCLPSGICIGMFMQKKDMQISEEDFFYIRSQLNEEVENSIGYILPHCKEEVPYVE
jgi:hypothetical protein